MGHVEGFTTCPDLAEQMVKKEAAQTGKLFPTRSLANIRKKKVPLRLQTSRVTLQTQVWKF